MGKRKAPEPEPLECMECKVRRNNLVAHLTPQGELLQLCPRCMARRYLK